MAGYCPGSRFRPRSGDSTLDWLAIGWGDKDFYLNTPTWADLQFGTAVKAIFGLSPAAIHTCNTWINNALKASGQKACWWTPFDGGILHQYR